MRKFIELWLVNTAIVALMIFGFVAIASFFSWAVYLLSLGQWGGLGLVLLFLTLVVSLKEWSDDA